MASEEEVEGVQSDDRLTEEQTVEVESPTIQVLKAKGSIREITPERTGSTNSYEVSFSPLLGIHTTV